MFFSFNGFVFNLSEEEDTMKTRTWIAIALVFCMVVISASSAFADYDSKETWFVGAQVGTWSVNPFLAQIYEERGSIKGVPFGLSGGYKWFLNRTADVEVVGVMEYWSMDITDSTYLAKGASLEDTEDLRSNGNVSMFSLGVMARFAIKAHPIVQPIFSLGMDLGFPSGKLEKRDYILVNEGRSNETAIPDPAGWEKAAMPGVIPVLDMLVGIRFAIPKNVTIDINGGIRSGLYLGAGVNFFY
jgi:hypothetical protein